MDPANPRTHGAHCLHPPRIDLQPDGAVRAINHAASRLLQDNAEILGMQGGRLVAADSAGLQRCM